MGKSSQILGNKDKKKPNFWQKEKKLPNIGTKSMQNTSAYEELRSSGKQLHEYSFDPRSIQLWLHCIP